MDISEKSRPRSLEQIVAQPWAVAQIKHVAATRGLIGTAWWLGGPTGTGKTSIARIMANMVAKHDCNVYELVGRDVLADTVRDMMERVGQPTLVGSRAWIINEAQDIPAPSVALLLDAIERVKASKHDALIFTTMKDFQLRSESNAHYWAMVGRCYVPDMADTTTPEYRDAVVNYIAGMAQDEQITLADPRALCASAGWSIREAVTRLDMLAALPPGYTPRPVTPVDPFHGVRAGNVVQVKGVAEPVLVNRVTPKYLTTLPPGAAAEEWHRLELVQSILQ